MGGCGGAINLQECAGTSSLSTRDGGAAVGAVAIGLRVQQSHHRPRSLVEHCLETLLCQGTALDVTRSLNALGQLLALGTRLILHI